MKTGGRTVVVSGAQEQGDMHVRVMTHQTLQHGDKPVRQVWQQGYCVCATCEFHAMGNRHTHRGRVTLRDPQKEAYQGTSHP